MSQSLAEMLGPDVLFFDEPTRREFAGDKWSQGALPDMVARPRTTAEVATILAWANERAVSVTPRGAGWGYVGGAITNRGGVLLSLDRLNAIREISGDDFVAVVEAGVLTGDLQEAVKARGLFYPPDPASLKYSSIGGNIAANAGGPRCLKYGVTRHYVLGLEVVLPDGRILQLGGRTHKNKTGFDLLGLFVGSEGMLGVVTGATLRLLPHPPARAALSAIFPTLEGAASGVKAIFAAGILPAATEIADAFTLRCFRESQGLPLDENAGAHVLVECDGQLSSVREELELVAHALKTAGASEISRATSEADVEALWQTRRAFSLSLNAPNRAKLNEDIVVPRGKLLELVAFCEALGARHGVQIACFGHAGDGNIHVNLLLPTDPDAPENSQEKAQSALDELFAQVLSWGGAITGEHGIGLAKARWWPEAVSCEVREMHREMKRLFDPIGILNPGKWV